MFEEYGVIFDMDGVLVDTGPIHFDSWIKLAEKIGNEFTKSFFEKTFGQTSTEIVRKLVGSSHSQEKIKKWAYLKEKFYREMVKDRLKPLKGVLDLIKDSKKRNFKLAVGSSGPSANVELILNKLNIKHFFDCIITAEDVKYGKPDPSVFLTAAKKLNIKPENCIVIEDAPVGIEAAKRARMKCIAITTTHNKKELLNADLVVREFSEINLDNLFKSSPWWK